MSQRKIILHLHLFKNAGTSIDRILSENFGSRWMAYDCEQPGTIMCAEQFEEVIHAHPGIEAFSSHQLVPPLPDMNVFVFPIVFIRHPVERIKSAYLFEWKKQGGLDFPKGTLQEYIDSKLQNRRRNVIEDFQTMRLSNAGKKNFQNIDKFSDSELLERAKSFLDHIPCVGVVDRFDESIEIIQNEVNNLWPTLRFFATQENVSQDINQTTVEKLDGIRRELGDESYQQIVNANLLDIELYDYACQLLDQSLISNKMSARAQG